MDDRGQSCPGSLPDPDPGWAAYAAWLEGGLRFGQGDGADVLPPGPLLAGLTEEAVRDFGVLSDDELVGVLQAARRQEARESYKQVLAVAEFARRREAAFEDAKARGVPAGCRAGGFPGEELAVELVTTPVQAGHRIETATPSTASSPHPPKATRLRPPRPAQGSPGTRLTPRPSPADRAPAAVARTRGQGRAVTKRTAPGTTARQAKSTTR